MACSECGRDLTGRPNAICPNVAHWRAWSEETEARLHDLTVIEREAEKLVALVNWLLVQSRAAPGRR